MLEVVVFEARCEKIEYSPALKNDLRVARGLTKAGRHYFRALPRPRQNANDFPYFKCFGSTTVGNDAGPLKERPLIASKKRMRHNKVLA